MSCVKNTLLPTYYSGGLYVFCSLHLEVVAQDCIFEAILLCDLIYSSHTLFTANIVDSGFEGLTNIVIVKLKMMKEQE